MKNIKDIFSVIALIAFIIFFIYQISTAGIRKEDILKRKGRTTGIVLYEGGTGLKIEYEIKGYKFIFKRRKPYPSIQNGEKFVIAYNLEGKLDPIPIYYEPITNDVLFDTIKSIGEINWLFGNYLNSQKKIGFNYQVNGSEFYKMQVLGFDIEKEDIDLNKSYPVIFNVQNPKIAYILLK